MKPMGYAKIAGQLHEIGSSGLDYTTFISESTRDSTTNGTVNTSKTITAPAGHDYLLIANGEIYSTNSSITGWYNTPTVTITGATIKSSYYLPGYSPGSNDGAFGSSFSITDIVSASDSDQSIVISFTGRVAPTSGTKYYFYHISAALIELN